MMVVRRNQLLMDLKTIFFLFSISFVNGQNGIENEKTDCTAFLIGEFFVKEFSLKLGNPARFN